MQNISIKYFLVSLLFVLAIGGTILEARATLGAVQNVHQQQFQVKHQDVHLVRSWMTIPYVSYVYNVPATTLCQSLQVPNDHQIHHKTLAIIANEKHRPVSAVIATLQATITNYRKLHPLPTPPGQVRPAGIPEQKGKSL
ncbi:hypothetical protein [Tengunoibacter tsumagoiensis]|uniref:Uncharacterized protein n=1 Tax=Tengunoibacter tsumagoiensis TaxID=2014871 RepID=A0A401ZTY3_9CHLR|nr:hypothetical protein [Tengunoibacter tsumagoiensis]GCE10272.1 hypothetical protein KTT_01310 [Tengunoibacter tsumagoiensis]